MKVDVKRWVRVDEGFCDHPKVLAAGLRGAWVHLSAITYSSRHLTDGFIAEAVASRLLWPEDGEFDEHGNWELPDAVKIAAHLVNVGLWEEVEGGYRLHDYLDYNRSRAEVMAAHDERQRSGKKGGIGSARVRRTRQALASKELEATGKLTPSSSSSLANGELEANVKHSTTQYDTEHHDTERKPVATSEDPQVDTLSRAKRTRRRRASAPETPCPSFDVLNTEALRSYARRRGCGNPQLAIEHGVNDALAKGRLQQDWPAFMRKWFDNHGRYGCPCQRGNNGRPPGAVPVPKREPVEGPLAGLELGRGVK